MRASGWRRQAVAIVGAAVIVAGTAGVVAATGATHAGATIADGNGATIGWARFTEDAAGRLHVSVQVAGISPGRHGIHLHAIGSCVGPTFASAGGHHNPLGAQHGLDNQDGAHAGDLPNMEVNVAGRGRLEATTNRATLSYGATSLVDVDGSAIVIHAAEDDQVTNPTGNSGARIACGVIEVAG